MAMKRYRGRGPGAGAGGKVVGTRDHAGFSFEMYRRLKDEFSSVRVRLEEARLGENFDGDPSWVEGQKSLTHRPFGRFLGRP